MCAQDLSRAGKKQRRFLAAMNFEPQPGASGSRALGSQRHGFLSVGDVGRDVPPPPPVSTSDLDDPEPFVLRHGDHFKITEFGYKHTGREWARMAFSRIVRGADDADDVFDQEVPFEELQRRSRSYRAAFYSASSKTWTDYHGRWRYCSDSHTGEDILAIRFRYNEEKPFWHYFKRVYKLADGEDPHGLGKNILSYCWQDDRRLIVPMHDGLGLEP